MTDLLRDDTGCTSDVLPFVQSFVSCTEDLLQQAKVQTKPIFALTDGARILWDQRTPITIVAGGKTEAAIELAGRSQADIVCAGHSRVTIISRGDSTGRIYAKHFSNVMIKTFGLAKPLINGGENSRIQVLAYENSCPVIKAVDSCISTLIVHDHAEPRCFGWPVDWRTYPSDIYIGQRILCIATQEEAIVNAKSLFKEWRQCQNRYIACQRISGSVPKICSNVVDFRWRGGTVHLELPGNGNSRPWFGLFDHHFASLTEKERECCMHCYLE
ncbi:MAG TPA: hypothetical protein PKK68_07915 [Methanothrix soehngenii]|jgi:hypothetical protein|nr:hypothetical protein [Methanothrix soehngenii]